MKTKQEVIEAISVVEHPAIAFSLVELGIVKDIELNENIVSVTFAFPFPNIPIATQLIDSIEQPVKHLGLDFKYEIVIMTDEERERFMQMEGEAWRG